MYLIDSFIPVLTLVVDSIGKQTGAKDAEDDALDYAEFRNEVVRLIDATGIDDNSRLPQALYDDAKFAAMAFIDEKVLSSNWDKRHQWARELLQKQYFNTTNGGVEFYERLQKLSPYQPFEKSVIEVFYYCLCLGFVGNYYKYEDQPRLKALTESISQAIVSERGNVKLFPEAYVLNENDNYEPPTRSINLKPLFYGLPIVFVLGLFVYYQSEIRDLAQQFLLMV